MTCRYVCVVGGKEGLLARVITLGVPWTLCCWMSLFPSPLPSPHFSPQMSATQDPVTLQHVYTISQVWGGDGGGVRGKGRQGGRGKGGRLETEAAEIVVFYPFSVTVPADLARPLPPAQIDVTAAVHAQRQLQQAHALLAEEKVRIRGKNKFLGFTGLTLVRTHSHTESWVSDLTLTDALTLWLSCPPPARSLPSPPPLPPLRPPE